MDPCLHAPAERPHHALAEAGLPEHVVRGRPGLVVGEIAGRDSIAALVGLTRERTSSDTTAHHEALSILPTAVTTAGEYGEWSAPAHAVHVLRDRVAGKARVFDLVRLTSPTLWRALNGRFGAELSLRYGSWSPCAACHLYVHLCRVPLAWAIGAKVVVSGERDAHRGRIKLSQTPSSIAASTEVLAYAGLDLLEPVEALDEDTIFAELVGDEWADDAPRLECMLADNFVALDGTVVWDPGSHERYLAEFFIPAGKAVVDAWRESHLVERPDAPLPDYVALVRGVLEAGPR